MRNRDEADSHLDRDTAGEGRRGRLTTGAERHLVYDSGDEKGKQRDLLLQAVVW